MQISPRAQALMLAVSAAVGVAAGSIFDLIGVFYRSLGVGRVPAYYDSVLPLVGAVGRRGKVGGVAASVVLWCVDMLFPVAWASAQLCVFCCLCDTRYGSLHMLPGGVCRKGNIFRDRSRPACGIARAEREAYKKI